MKSLNYAQFLHLLSQPTGARPVGLTTYTDSKARKTGNPFGQIFKHCRSVGFVGAHYESAVNRQLRREDKEGNFSGESLPWGEWLVPNKVISHKGEYYLRVQTSPGQRQRQPARVLAYYAPNGEAIPKTVARSYITVSAPSAKQAGAGLTSESEIMVRTYKFSSIRRVRINGETYRLIP